nr:MAG TPA: hypothetical protein [Caudoviricetes sp.]
MGRIKKNCLHICGLFFVLFSGGFLVIHHRILPYI